MAKNHLYTLCCFVRILNTTYFLHQGFHAQTMENVLFFRPMPFLSFLSQRYHYILVERNIELDISNRIGDASATAAASIHPIGDFLRSRKQNNSFYLRTLSDHFIGNGMVRKQMVIQINKNNPTKMNDANAIDLFSSFKYNLIKNLWFVPNHYKKFFALVE